MNKEQIKERIKLNSDLLKMLIAFEILAISGFSSLYLKRGTDVLFYFGLGFCIFLTSMLFVYFFYIFNLIKKL